MYLRSPIVVLLAMPCNRGRGSVSGVVVVCLVLYSRLRTTAAAGDSRWSLTHSHVTRVVLYSWGLHYPSQGPSPLPTACFLLNHLTYFKWSNIILFRDFKQFSGEHNITSAILQYVWNGSSLDTTLLNSWLYIGKKIKLLVLMDSVLIMSSSSVGFKTISRNYMLIFKLLVAVCNTEYLYFLVSV